MKLTARQIQSNKNDFVQIFDKFIIPQYQQAKKLLEYIQSTDFFEAPASTKYHSAFKGGLCLHSLLVYDRFNEEVDNYKKDIDNFTYEGTLGTTKAGMALISLCHDLCKCNTYELFYSNVKDYNENGKMHDDIGNFDWVQKENYKYNEQFVLGHGSKSLYLIMKYIPELSLSETTALYYHMGGLDNPLDKSSSQAFATYPLALLLHIADMKATFLDEERN